MVDLDSLSDNYNEDKTELVKFSSSTSDVYINYWYSLAPKNAVFSQIEDSVGTDDTNLALLFTQLEEGVLNDVFLLNLTQVKQESIFVNNGIAQLKVYLAEFEDKVQHVSSIAWISDKYIITSVVLPLDMYLPKSQGILDPIQLGDLAKVHLHSCKLSTN
ncbi:hypothetical protein MN202_03610 [Rheinheimera muenzenbergensis]|uniref:Uncharacterized protein n=1 Tax=Rheinheimera muenzenbergensis TaxID=1193628 RepID=A0ABU8C3B4_9GAMM